MTPGVPKRPEPVPKPGVIVGDEVYCHHPKGAHAGRVVAHGKHGVTLEGGHKVRWEHVLGHKRRAGQEFKIIDEGEDGCIAEDKNGLRQFIAVPPEAREEQMVVKAGMGQRLALFAKADGTPYMGRPGLSKKVITDRRGVQTTRWVRTTPDAPHPLVGHHVGWQNGDVRAHGQVASVGRDGAMVRDKSGGMHAVRHEHITHHWADKTPPERSPHEPPDRPSYAPRQDGESDKAYAKRVVDTGDAVHDLPEDHDRYFNTAGAARVPLDRLHSTKTEEENQQGGDNGPKRMLAAYHGVLGKRDPITVMPHASKPGHHEVVDGNGALTSAKRLGWKSLPVKVVSREEGEAIQKEERINEAVKAAKLEGLFQDPANDNLPSDPRTRFKSWEEIEAAAPEAQDALEKLLESFGSMMSAEKVDRFEDVDYTKPGIIYGMGPIKKADSAARKVQKYGGDWSRLADVVRASIGFDSVEELKAGVEKLQASGLKLAAKADNKFVRPTNAGYRDMNLNILMPNGLIGELQLHLKPVLQAKSDGHKDYEVTRVLDQKAKKEPPPLTPAEAQELQARLVKQRLLYGSAMERGLGIAKPPKMMHKSLPRGTMVLFQKGGM